MIFFMHSLETKSTVRFFTLSTEEMDEDVDCYCSVDMRKGLVVALDIKRHTFEFIAGQRSYGVASASISGQYFYPFLVYNGRAHKPIRIQYLGGPKSK